MIDWAPPDATHDEACPVCAAAGPHALLLTARAVVSRDLAACGACGARFYTDRTPTDYELEEPPLHVQLYLEQGAGLEMLTSLPFAVEMPAPCRLLEVGCGFGFTVDLARRVLGWDAVGFDPTPTTGLGARLLGAPLRRAFLRPDTDTGGPFDLVLACETIEHVPDPDGFLDLLASRLRHGGVLILTTPNGAAVTRGATAGDSALFQMLSPGSHLILHSAASLRALLGRAGFTHVEIEESATGLTALASRLPPRRRADRAAAHRLAYRRYLAMLCQSAPSGEWLWNGAAARLLGLAAGEDALALFDQIADVWQARHGFDIRRARAPLGADARAMTPDAFARSYPFCLAPVLLARARLANAGPGRSVDLALKYAAAAGAVAQVTLTQIRRSLMDDGALREVAWTSRLMRARLFMEIEPDLRLDLLAALGVRGGVQGDDSEPPGSVLMREAADVFIATVHGGHYAEAARIAHLFEERALIPQTFGDAPDIALHLLFCLGVLERNGRGRRAAAAAHFAALVDLACELAAAPATASVAVPFIALGISNEREVHDGGLPPARLSALAGKPAIGGALRDELHALMAP